VAGDVLAVFAGIRQLTDVLQCKLQNHLRDNRHASEGTPMMLTRHGTTIRNIPRVDAGTRQPGRVAVSVTRVDGSSRVALSIGSDTTSIVRSYDIPLGQFLRLVASVITPDDLARAGIAAQEPGKKCADVLLVE
jgi:hypothetical protein